MVCVVDLKHGVGEDLQELLHLEGGWPLRRVWELRLLSFLLSIQFIVVQRYPFGLALLSYMRPNKGMIKGWLNGTHVQHSMKACMLNKGMLKGA